MPRVRKVRARDVPAAVAIAIAIVAGADAEVARAEVREAVREVTVVAAPAVVAVDAEEGSVLSRESAALKGRGFSRAASANKDVGFSP